VISGNFAGDTVVRVAFPPSFPASSVVAYKVTYGFNLASTTVVAGAPFSSLATFAFESISPGSGGAQLSVSAAIQANVRGPIVTASLPVSGTSNPDTGSSVGDPNVIDAVVGETVTADVVVYPAEGVTESLACWVDADPNPATRIFQLLSATFLSAQAPSRVTLTPATPAVSLDTAANSLCLAFGRAVTTSRATRPWTGCPCG
jgi:hypothetical protein